MGDAGIWSQSLAEAMLTSLLIGAEAIRPL